MFRGVRILSWFIFNFGLGEGYQWGVVMMIMMYSWMDWGINPE
jgi:hypothetical protein